MALINKIEQQLHKQGFYTSINQFGDNSAKWIDIFQSPKQKAKGRSIGNICFNIKGTKMIDISFHAKKNGSAITFKTTTK